ncbi:MAG: RDD family protein [Pirellulaceae bacterium]|nr:MAG: RDD family protein [Pirellulaceae bacterium]
MNKEWYYASGGRQMGPVSLAELQALAQAGRLHPTDLVWTQGMTDWAPAGSVMQIFSGAVNPYQAPTAPVAGVVDHVRYAGFWLRFVAAILDGLILYAASLPLIMLRWLVIGEDGEADLYVDPSKAWIDLSFNCVSIVIYWLYFALLESSAWQATLGKRALGLVVTDLDGNRISFARATGRHFAKILSGCLLIGYLMAAFTERKQALHDIVAGCLVIKKR